jgi:hypothetical protein
MHLSICCLTHPLTHSLLIPMEHSTDTDSRSSSQGSPQTQVQCPQNPVIWAHAVSVRFITHPHTPLLDIPYTVLYRLHLCLLSSFFPPDIRTGMCYLSRSSRLSWFNHANNFWCRVSRYVIFFFLHGGNMGSAHRLADRHAVFLTRLFCGFVALSA